MMKKPVLLLLMAMASSAPPLAVRAAESKEVELEVRGMT